MSSDTDQHVSDNQSAEEAAQHRKVSIIVNAQQKAVPSRDVSYDEVVALADLPPLTPDTTYTVMYENAVKPSHDGSLVQGQTVTVREEGTIFYVTRTNKS